MKVQFTRGFKSRLEKRLEGYEFEVGILDDKPHRLPVVTPQFEPPRLKVYAGGPARLTSGERSDVSIGDVLIQNMDRLGVDLLREPFQKKSTDIMRFTREYLRLVFGKVNRRRVENLLQAVVRNPILRSEYGSNSPKTADNKGFDRHLIDTSQMFRSIRARIDKMGR